MSQQHHSPDGYSRHASPRGYGTSAVKRNARYRRTSSITGVLLCAIHVYRHVPVLHMTREQLRIDRDLLRETLASGSVTALQQACQPIGKAMIQRVINDQGVAVIAAFNAVSRVDDFACIPEQGISSAISTYIAQNRGAKKKKRIAEGFWTGIRMEAAYGVFIAAVTFLLRNVIVSLFVSGEAAEEVIRIGSSYLSVMAFMYLFPAMTNGFQGFYRGMGRMRMTILGTTTQISVRTLFTILLAPKMGIKGIAFASGIGWLCMLLFEVPICIASLRKMRNSK